MQHILHIAVWILQFHCFRHAALAGLLSIIVSIPAVAFGADNIGALADNYLEHYFRMFPTRATQAGRHNLDQQLEDFSRKPVALWIDFNRATRATLAEPATARGRAANIAHGAVRALLALLLATAAIPKLTAAPMAVAKEGWS